MNWITRFYYLSRRWLKAGRLFIAIAGPGIVVMIADNDAGGITTYAATGAKFQYGLIWFLIILGPEIVNEMTPAQAADILAALPGSDTDAILEKLDAAEAEKIRSLIEKHDERILDVATTRYISFSADTKVSELIRRFRTAAKDAEVVMYVYVTDTDNHLLGVVDIKEILKAGLDETMQDIMTTNIVSLDENDTIASAYRLFARYSFRAIPVVGEGNFMIGAVPYRDIMQLSHRLV